MPIKIYNHIGQVKEVVRVVRAETKGNKVKLTLTTGQVITVNLKDIGRA